MAPSIRAGAARVMCSRTVPEAGSYGASEFADRGPAARRTASGHTDDVPGMVPAHVAGDRIGDEDDGAEERHRNGEGADEAR